MKPLFKTFLISLQLILITALLSIGYGYITTKTFTPVYIFKSNFVAGAFIICTAIVMMIFPVFLKFGKLIDHSTFSQFFMEKREQKREKAYEFLYLGIMVIINTGLIQLVFAALIP